VYLVDTAITSAPNQALSVRTSNQIARSKAALKLIYPQASVVTSAPVLPALPAFHDTRVDANVLNNGNGLSTTQPDLYHSWSLGSDTGLSHNHVTPNTQQFAAQRQRYLSGWDVARNPNSGVAIATTTSGLPNLSSTIATSSPTSRGDYEDAKRRKMSYDH
jgi:hypothetical protein